MITPTTSACCSVCLLNEETASMSDDIVKKVPIHWLVFSHQDGADQHQ